MHRLRITRSWMDALMVCCWSKMGRKINRKGCKGRVLLKSGLVKNADLCVKAVI
jgi:hypothetical protein